MDDDATFGLTLAWIAVLAANAAVLIIVLTGGL